MNRFWLLLFLVGAISSAAFGQTVIVNEDFEGYADEAALHAVWAGNPDSGTEADFVLTMEAAGINADFNGDNFVDAADYPIWRKNIGTQPEYDAWRAQFGGPPSGGPANTYVNRVTPNVAGNLVYQPPLDPNYFDGSIYPSQGLEPIVLRADIFTPVSNIQRNTVGLRAAGAENIFEMGMYNSGPNQTAMPDGTTGAAVQGTNGQHPANAGFGVRATIFFNQTGANPADPDWQFFAFDPAWDTNSNGLVTEFEVFAGLGIAATGGWHTLEATFTPLEPGGTVQAGDVNITVTIDLLRDGMNNAQNTPGVDGTITITNLRVTDNGFASLRFGGPSQVTSNAALGFDNIYLSGPQVTLGSGSAAAVPEPATAGLALLAMTGWLAAGRCRRSRYCK